MKHKSNFKVGSLPQASCADLTKTEKFHALSYYLNGGIDLSGRELSKDADVEFDSAEQLAELEQEGAMSVPYGDPRMSKFRLVELYGAVEAKKVAAKSPKGLKNDSNGTEGAE